LIQSIDLGLTNQLTAQNGRDTEMAETLKYFRLRNLLIKIKYWVYFTIKTSWSLSHLPFVTHFKSTCSIFDRSAEATWSTIWQQ